MSEIPPVVLRIEPQTDGRFAVLYGDDIMVITDTRAAAEAARMIWQVELDTGQMPTVTGVLGAEVAALRAEMETLRAGLLRGRKPPSHPPLHEIIAAFKNAFADGARDQKDAYKNFVQPQLGTLRVQDRRDAAKAAAAAGAKGKVGRPEGQRKK
jgi:hypothetical protein